ncbi:MAG TPA: SpoIIE family protein phosphatase [Spirochaetota bacterium]|nr:SpoIIE family protein phosphatase [Spirochaetota bacterium]HPJ33623.1 SpoIIE family protein phosphatase [Spirochaetota bacterium]
MEISQNNRIGSLERQVENLSKLVEINGIINSTLNINRLLSIIMEMIKDIMKTEASSLLLFDEESKELVFKVALGEAGDELMEKYRVKLGQGIAGWVALNRRDIIANDVYSDSRFDSMYDKSTGFLTRAILCAPLLFKGKLLGVIQAINPVDRDKFDDSDMSLFRIFSNQAALAVQNAIFFQKAIEEERLLSEINAAKAIHNKLAPLIEIKDRFITAAAKSFTAREVGGGFHNFREIDEGMFLLTLGNLDNKGIPGAMGASTLSGLMKAMIEIKGYDPEEIIRMVNRFCDDDMKCNDGISLFIARIDAKKRKMKFVNSGDCFPLLIRNKKVYYLRFAERTGGYLGENGFSASNINFKLNEGDRFIVFSAGITELKNRDGKQLGLQGIIRFLEENEDEPCDMIESVIKYADDYTGGTERRKDLTIVSFMV